MSENESDPVEWPPTEDDEPSKSIFDIVIPNCCLNSFTDLMDDHPKSANR